MENKNQYQAFLRAKVKGALTEANAASSLTHNGVKGTVLEILISKLFKPLLPSDVGVGTGQIIEQHLGRMSNQVDIILYDKTILPPALYNETTGLFPIEAVLYAIEVKTRLTATELSKAHDAAFNILDFRYLNGLENQRLASTNDTVERVRWVVFALNSDLSGRKMNEAQRYEIIYRRKKHYPHIRAICVAGREYWFDDGEYWRSAETINEYDEVLAFIGGVTNTYKKVARSRHYPLLGNYIIPEAELTFGPQTQKINRIKVVCGDCGHEALVRPILPKGTITVNGSISSNDPCPKCSGKMSSALGKYEFKDGNLTIP